MDELFSEAGLRGALRLDADERPARLDAGAIAQATQARPRRVGMALGVAVVLLAAAAVLTWSGLETAAESELVVTALATLIGLLVPVAGLAVSLATPAAAFAVSLALLAAAVHERVTGRELVHVQAS